ncbi:MAG: hypothetical protein ACRCZF_26150, partial [Gemmataceae bacterium]
MARPDVSVEFDDERIGIPVPRRPKPSVATNIDSDLADAPEPVELRPGETELGRPVQVARDLQPLSETDRARILAAEESEAARALLEAEELLNSEPVGLSWLGGWASPVAGALLLAAIGLFGLFVTSQVLSTLQALSTQPTWVQYVGY